MQNQKSAAIISSFSVMLFVVVATYLLYEPIQNYLETERYVSEQVNVSRKTCKFESDRDAHKTAITSKDIGFCECIEEKREQKSCKKDTLDIILFDRALAQLDDDLCKKIENEIQKIACEKNVQQTVEELKESNPQKLAEIYALAHNAKAIEQLEEVLLKKPDNQEVLLSLALAYAEQGLREREQGRDHMGYVEKSFDVIKKMKEITPNDSEVYRAEGYTNEIKSDYNASLNAYSTSIKLDEKNVLAYAGRGHVYRILGKLELAVEDFMTAASIDKEREHVFVYTNLCNLKYTEGDIVAVKRYCKIVINKSDADPVFLSESHQILAMVYAQNGDYVYAKNALLLAKTANPSDPNVYVTFSKVNYLEKNYKESEQYALTALDMSPFKTTAYLAQARALYGQNKYHEAAMIGVKGLDYVSGDVSLLTAMKTVVQNDLLDVVAKSYSALGNHSKQKEYERRIQ